MRLLCGRLQTAVLFTPISTRAPARASSPPALVPALALAPIPYFGLWLAPARSGLGSADDGCPDAEYCPHVCMHAWGSIKKLIGSVAAQDAGFAPASESGPVGMRVGVRPEEWKQVTAGMKGVRGRRGIGTGMRQDSRAQE